MNKMGNLWINKVSSRFYSINGLNSLHSFLNFLIYKSIEFYVTNINIAIKFHVFIAANNTIIISSCIKQIVTNDLLSFWSIEKYNNVGYIID